MKDKSLVEIYLKMFSLLKPTMNFDDACKALHLENKWGKTQFTATNAIELFITFANREAMGKATYVFGGDDWKEGIKKYFSVPVPKKVIKNQKKCRKNSLVKVK